MKIYLFITSLIILVGSLSNAQILEPISFGSKHSSLTGLIPPNVKVSATFMYSPDATSLAQKKCDFQDDAYNANNKDRQKSVDAQIKNGSYKILFSMTASRDQCQYHISSIYLSINSKKVYELISMTAQNLIQRIDEIAVLDAASISPIYCDFEGVADKDCSVDSHYADYDFSPTAKTIVIDLKDNSEKPADSTTPDGTVDLSVIPQ